MTRIEGTDPNDRLEDTRGADRMEGPGGTWVAADMAGDQAADGDIRLDGRVALHVADFVL